MAAGRGLSANDDVNGAAPAGVLSYALWSTRFNADASLIGRTITLDDVPVMVVGVTAAGFAGTIYGRVDLWLPLAAARCSVRTNAGFATRFRSGPVQVPRLSGYLALAGRLAPGATRAQAEAELTSLAMEFESVTAPRRQGSPDVRHGRSRRARRREHCRVPPGIRMALGAREAQVVQLVLGSSGRAIAVGLAFGAAGALAASSVLRSSLYGLSMVDPIAYLSVGLLLVAASLAATALPARRASRVNPLEALRCE